jgi:Pyruvate/2-oxoacid:ferredoxin oxidoreductase delta subunit
MDFGSFVQGPLLCFAFTAFFLGLTVRLVAFLGAVLRAAGAKNSHWKYAALAIVRTALPLHRSFQAETFHVLLRYVFHIALFVVSIFLAGHIVLWEESRFELTWTALPAEWADYLTILVLALLGFFLIYRIVRTGKGSGSKVSDYLLLLIPAMPFVTGYLLAHESGEGIRLFGIDMWTLHILSGETMLVATIFLFCRTRLSPAKCIGCAACAISCPTGALEHEDKERTRIFKYSHYQCICCGECKNVCPDHAAELVHELAIKPFFRIVSKYSIRTVELSVCRRCGALFAPTSQIQKPRQRISGEYICFCPDCKAAHVAEKVHTILS